jgi:DNA-binding transcriptional MerR regulator
MNTREHQSIYTIGELARLAGVSVRTLRHYDQIGLLKPQSRNDNDYRQYGFADLLRLQHILFFRELDIPLKKIKAILDDPLLDRTALLRKHHCNLELQIERLRSLQATIEKTIHNLQEEDDMPLTDAELYEGFSKEKIETYNREVRQTYDPDVVKEVERNVRNMSKAQWQDIKDEGGAIAAELAKLIDHDPAEPDVQTLIARQHAWIENFFPAPAKVFRGLGELYATHKEFRAFYDRYAPGLADFMREAMNHYADTKLTENTLA